jgi:hypothetical protein
MCRRKWIARQFKIFSYFIFFINEFMAALKAQLIQLYPFLNGYRGSFPRVKLPERDVGHAPLAPRLKMNRADRLLAL